MAVGREKAGVYVLGRFDECQPPVQTNPMDPSVICIVETHDQSFEDRWAQFEVSAFQGGYGHSPGLNFFEAFMNSTPGDPPQWLYVAVMPLGEPKEEGKAEVINDAKRRLLTQYKARHGRLPRCNRVIS